MANRHHPSMVDLPIVPPPPSPNNLRDIDTTLLPLHKINGLLGLSLNLRNCTLDAALGLELHRLLLPSPLMVLQPPVSLCKLRSLIDEVAREE